MSVIQLPHTDLPAQHLPDATGPRWQPLRAGVQNVWQYDHTTRFVFHHGRLLLRGRNGVGKTKVVEVLLPFLLEGRMEPARLDPFGTRSRKMRYNLLHEANADAQTNVGYVWLELGRHDPDTGQPRYLTIGAGLKARRASDGVEAWFFVVQDRRVDADLHLLDDDRYPLARPALADAIGGDGHVYTAAQDYRHAVNRALYGVEDEQYDAMLDALLRLRQPHLSERLDPPGVAALLAQSLPPLDAERIREVAEGFERLEGHRHDLADRRRAHDAVSGFMAVYRSYARAVLARAAKLLTVANSRRDKAAQAIAAAEEEHAAALLDRTQLEEERTDLDRRQLATTERLRTLEGSEAYKAVAELERAERDAEQASRAHRAVAQRHQQEETAAADAGNRRAIADRAADDMARQLAEVLREAAAQARRADLIDAHDTVHDLLDPRPEGPARDAAIGAAEAIRDQRRADVTRVRQAQARRGEATRARDVADSRHDQAAEQLDRAEGSVAAAEETLTAARRTFADDAEVWQQTVTDWAEGGWVARAAALQPDAPEGEGSAAAGLRPDLPTLIGRLRGTDLLDVPAEAARAAALAVLDPLRAPLDDAVTTASMRLQADRDAQAALVAEHDRVERQTHGPPPPPLWRTADRTGRAGAPLYLLVDFAPDVTDDVRPRIEAALGAAGLLDAWVTPDGTVADALTGDVLIHTSAGRPDQPAPAGGHTDRSIGATLAEVLVPTPHDGVEAPVVAAVLDAIGWVNPGSGVRQADADRVVQDIGSAAPPPGGGPAGRGTWVAADGSWAVGVLRGRADDLAAARFVGATAREAHRQQRLAQLTAAIADADARIGRAKDLRALLQGARTRLDGLVAAFPATTAIDRAALAVETAAAAHDVARTELADAAAALDTATDALTRATTALDDVAGLTGLRGHLDRLDVLLEDTHDWVGRIIASAGTAEHLADRRQQAVDAAAAHDRALQRVADAAADLRRAEAAATTTIERATTLRHTVGADREQILADVQQARSDGETIRQRSAAVQDELIGVAERKGAAEKAVEAGQTELSRQEADRDAAADTMRTLAAGGLLALVIDAVPDDPPAHWGIRQTLDVGRAVQKATGTQTTAPDDLDAQAETAKNILSRRHQELQRDLVAGIRLFAREDHGVVVHDVQYQGRTLTLPGLVEELTGDIAEREARLEQGEQELLEAFLTGELHAHLRSRIRTAGDLVRRMNDLLAGCPTPSGQRVRLDWQVGADAPPGTDEAVDLLLKGGHLLTDAHRADLTAFLQQRLRDAREGDVAVSLSERLTGAFDYRRWHAFTIRYRDPSSTSWKPLTRQRHGTGSGGEKAVMLHLPLFAAMAAHYDGMVGAPRLIVLDEVFAGIDRGTRGQLMGLLVAMDLDALLTSHEEWGCYAELDGVSTYNLLRDPAVPGVLAEWFVWDGQRQWEMAG